MIKRCWPELCWYIKQHEQRKAHNSREEAHIGSTVPLLSLIFTVLHFVFSPFHNAVIWERSTHRVGALVHTQMIKSNSSQWSFFLCLCCRQTYMSNSTQIIKVRTHEMSEGSVGGVALWFRTFLSAATPQIYPAANSEEESSVFASPVLTHTVEENCDIINIAALCQMMTLKLERCNRV